MNTARYIHWQDQGMWLGYFEEFPDYFTQGETVEELEENLRDLYRDLTSWSHSPADLGALLGNQGHVYIHRKSKVRDQTNHPRFTTQARNGSRPNMDSELDALRLDDCV